MHKSLAAKMCFFAFLSLFLLGLASMASAEDLYNEWHYSGDTFTVEGDVIMITHYDFYDTTVLLTVNKNTYIMKEGECKETPTRQYCIQEIFQDLDDAEEGDPIKFEGGKAYAGIKVLIRSKGPDIEVSRSFSKTSVEINQEVSVIITIENNGVEGTDSFIYQENFPTGIVLTSFSEGIGMGSHSISYGINMPAKSSKSFTYTVKIADYAGFTSVGIFNYTYAGQKVSSVTSGVSITVTKPYDFTASISPASLEAGYDRSTLTWAIKNTVSEDIDVLGLNITIPAMLSVMSSSSELQKTANTYSWQGTLDSGETKTLTMQVKPIKSGKYTIPSSIKIKDFSGKNFSDSKNLTLSAELKQLEVTLSVLETTVAEGGLFRVALSIKNPNEKIGFRNIKTRIKSEIIPTLSADLEELVPGKIQVMIVNDTLTAPFLDERENYDIEAYGSYETTTNEEYNFSKKASLTVTPVQDIISIIQSVDSSEVMQGENVTVTVEIKNNNEESIQVSAYDDYPAALTEMGGKASETVSFDRSGQKQAYTYKLGVPVDYDQKEIKITTFATVGGKNYAGNRTITVKVTPRPVEEKNETAEEQPGEQEQQQQEQQNQTAEPEQKTEKKPNFISKIFTGISDFFKRLFGKK